MKLTQRSKNILARRRENRKMTNAGYELVDNLNRLSPAKSVINGFEIIDSKIAANGKGVWVKWQRTPAK